MHKDGRQIHLHKSNGVHHVHATTLSKLCPLEDLRNDDGPPAEIAGEVNLPWTRRLPYRPTEDERMSHSISHLSFRAWCVHNVKGLAHDWSHHGECGPQPDIPMDAKNFCFTNTESVDDAWTILAMREKPFQFAGATVLPVRTVSEITVATIIGYLDCWDRQEFITKCNQQQNMVRRAELLQGRRRPRRTIVESILEGRRQNNGTQRHSVCLLEYCGAQVELPWSHLGEFESETSREFW